MTIEDFLEETADRWDKKSFQEADNDLKKLSTDAWIRKWGPAIMANKDMAADFYALKNFKPLPERITGAFQEFQFNPTDAWKQQIYQSEFSDVPREEFERVLGNMKKYYDEEIARQDSIGARNEREKEVKKWGWRNLVASDYEKARYINEPQKALFGKQAPALGKAPETRWAAGADLTAGTVGTVADFIPPAWVVGPAIRTGRDVTYMALGSEYAKDLVDIAISRAADFGINKVARFLPNARREQRIVQKATDPEVAGTLAADQVTKNVKDAVSATNPMNVYALMDDKTMVNTIKRLPESPMKDELMTVVNEVYPGQELNRLAIMNIYSKYKYLTSEGGTDAARALMKGNSKVSQPFAQNEYVKEMSLVTPYKELNNKQKASYLYNKLVNNVNAGTVGQIAVQGIADIHGRDHGNVEYDNSEEFKRQKDYYKKTRGEDWLKFGPAMAPDKDNKPAWEAYKEVTGIK